MRTLLPVWSKRPSATPAFVPGLPPPVPGTAATCPWRQYVPAYETWSCFGVRNLGHHAYEVRKPGQAPAPVMSMLTIYELALLYGVARHGERGRGQVCDLGPYYGLTT